MKCSECKTHLSPRDIFVNHPDGGPVRHKNPVDCVRNLQAQVRRKAIVSIENRGPGEVAAALAIEGYEVAAWCPTKDPSASKPEQVHLSINVPALPLPLVMRFKTRRAVELMAGTLMSYARDVWPEDEECHCGPDHIPHKLHSSECLMEPK